MGISSSIATGVIPGLNASKPAVPFLGEVWVGSDTGHWYLCVVAGSWVDMGASSGTGTVTSVSVTTANGVSGSVATATTTPAITLTLGAITPSSIAVSGIITQTSASATAFESGPNGSTNPVLRLVNSTASQADGISITGAASTVGTTIAAISSGGSSPIFITPKGTASIIIPDGTAAAPILRRSGDSTGFFFAGAGTIGASNNAAAQLFGVSATLFQIPTASKFNWSSNPTGAVGDAGLDRIAAKVVSANDGTTSATGWFVDAGTSRVSSQFDVTSSTVLVNITGLSATLSAGRKYAFVAELQTSSNVAGGVQVAIAGTATATSITYEGFTISAGTTTQTRATALGTAVGAITAVTAAHITIKGCIVCANAGTLTVQFAQNASNGTASSVLINSSFMVTDLNV